MHMLKYNLFSLNFTLALRYLWPLLLIAIGLELLTENKKLMKNFYRLSLLVFILFALFGNKFIAYDSIVDIHQPNNLKADMSIQSYSVPANKPAKLIIDEIGNNYNIGASDKDGIITDANTAIEIKERTDYKQYTLESIGTMDNDQWLNFALDKNQDWEIEIEAFSTNLKLDASELFLSKLEVSSLNSNLKLKFSEQNQTEIDLDGTDINLDLVLDGDVGYRIETDAINTTFSGSDELMKHGVMVDHAIENETYKQYGGLLIKIDAINAKINVD